MKKRYGTADFLGKYSKRMIILAKKNKDEKTENLFKDILNVLKKHGLKITVFVIIPLLFFLTFL